MLNVTIENIGELAVVECEGKIVQREAALTLRRAVTSQTDTGIWMHPYHKHLEVEQGGR